MVVLCIFKVDLDTERVRSHGGIVSVRVEEAGKNDDFDDIKKEANEMVVGEKA